MKSRARETIVNCTILLLSCTTISAQTVSLSAASPAASTPGTNPSTNTSVFHAETRLVVVDVVVTDNHGQPITDLEKDNFALSEGGKLQRLQFFEAHAPAVQPKAPAKIQLPPNQYTNFPVQAPASSVNIVLFDALNTPVTDQMYARWQMVRFIKALPPGRPVALFTLGSRLHMIAGFSTSSEDLVTAAGKVRPVISAVDEEPAAAQVPPAAPSGSIGSALYDPSSAALPNMTDEMNRFLVEQEASRTGDRIQQTLDAFNHLARALSGYSGRKNLLWLSEGFPITLSPDVLDGSSLGYLRSYATVLRESAALLSSSQISVYPIDVRGVRNSDPLRLQASYNAMDEIAKQTGGEAFYSTNDLKQAMQQSIERGSVYYTLAYVPENRKWDSRYRQIKIKIDRPGVKAEYRPGYFAVPDQPKPADDAKNRMIAAIQPGVPESTMLLLRVQVLPPDAQKRAVRIDYGVYAPDLEFSDGGDGTRRAKLEFMAAAWDRDNVPAGNISQTMELELKPTDYQAVLEKGLSAHLELALKPGSYTIRLGVLDYGNQKIGTLNVPLTIAKPVSAGR